MASPSQSNPKAALHQWSVLNKAMLVYNSYELEKPTPSQRFVSVLNVKTLPDNDFIPNIDVVFTSAPCPSKRASESDVAAAAMIELLKLDPSSKYDPLENIVLACAHAVKDPASSGAFKVVNFVMEAFHANECGWMPFDAFLLFSTVQTAINKVDSTNMRSPTGSSLCLRAAFMKLAGYERAQLDGKPSPLDLAAHVLEASDKDGCVRVRRKMFVTDKEFAFMKAHNSRVVKQKLVSEYQMVQTMCVAQIYPLRILILRHGSTTQANEAEEVLVTIESKHSVLSALDKVRDALGNATALAISRPLFHTERKTASRDDKGSGPRMLCSPVGDADLLPLNSVASWILNSEVRGDVALTNLAVGDCENMEKSTYFNIVASSLPSGLWLRGENLVLLHFPDVFLLDMWTRVPRTGGLCIAPLANHLPLQILEEFAVRRTGRGLLVQKETFSDLAAVGDARSIAYIERCTQIKADTRLHEQEQLPHSALWSDGLFRPNSSQQQQSPTLRRVAELQEIGVVKLTVPSAVFFMQEVAAADSFVTFVAEIPGSSSLFSNSDHVANAVQYCAFKALSAIELAGQQALFGAGQQYRSNVEIKRTVHLGEVAAAQCSHDYVEFQLSATGYSGVFAAFLGTGMLPPSLDSAVQPLTKANCVTDLRLDVNSLPFKRWPFEYRAPYDRNLSCVVKLLTRHQRITPLTLQIKERRQFQIFNPPLQAQRHSLVTAILRSAQAVSWLDVGCGEGQALLSTAAAAPGDDLHCPSLEYAAGLDSSLLKLERAQVLHSQAAAGRPPGALADKEGRIAVFSREFFLGSAQELCGSVLAARGWDVVSCIEVIEHLPSVDEAAQLALAVLGLRPRFAIFSTPNKEANVLIRAASQGMLSKDEKIEPTYLDEKFRHYDHHFEFSRQQFTDWCEGVLRLARADYSIEYTTLGNLLPQMRRIAFADGVVFEGYGGATQVAVFSRSGQGISSGGGATGALSGIQRLWGF